MGAAPVSAIATTQATALQQAGTDTPAHEDAPGGCLPPLFPQRAQGRLQEILDAEQAGETQNSEQGNQNEQGAALPRRLRDVLQQSAEARDLLLSVLGASNFLWRICAAEPQRLAVFLESDSKDACEAQLRLLLQETQDAANASDRNRLMAQLREVRRRVALLCALGEMRATWTLEQATEALSRFADLCLETSLAWLLHDARKRGDLREDVASHNCGLVFLGMGKYGARELNYSSDIDLIALYAPGVAPLAEHVQEKNFFVRITRDLALILQTPTALGHVFRVDLRLRPDAGSSAVAISIPAAESYYESVGRNWERAAFIKASVVAGDKDIGIDFLQSLRPFVWRKFLDAATIRDIHQMKERTHALKRARDAASGQGYDIKRGAGGIRAIEFFVQAQQLIAGGKDESLRSQTTCGGLTALARAGWIDTSTARDLAREYHFLRMLEHRLQMVNDEQTHALPRSSEDMDSLARFAGYNNGESLWRGVSGHLDEVERLVSGLFVKKQPAAQQEQKLIFPALEDDPATLERLSAMGFKDAARISATVREWEHGRIASLSSERERARLGALLDDIFKTALQNSEPDASIANFDALLRAQPAEAQLLSLFEANRKILKFLMRICSSAPRLANRLERSASGLQSLLEPQAIPDEETLLAQFQAQLEGAESLNAKLDMLRELVYEERFHLGMQLLGGNLSTRATGEHYAHLACAATRLLLPLVVEEEARQLRAKTSAEQEDELPDAETPVVVAMGKMGSGEMSPESDLDLIVIYDEEIVGDDAAWFQRIAQKLIAALSIPTVSGKLFTVDMRLRPFGASGPLATSLQRFKEYQRDRAWTWEHMALTRARVIAGGAPSQQRVSQAIHEILCRRRNRAILAADVADMRLRMWKENPSRNPWELKHVRGGLIDMEFISQYLQLAHAHDKPQLLQINNRDAFEKFTEAEILPADECRLLLNHWDLLHGLTQTLRLWGAKPPASLASKDSKDGKDETKTEDISEEFQSLLARAGGAPDFATLQRNLVQSQEKVHQLFDRLIGSQSATTG